MHLTSPVHGFTFPSEHHSPQSLVTLRLAIFKAIRSWMISIPLRKCLNLARTLDLARTSLLFVSLCLSSLFNFVLSHLQLLPGLGCDCLSRKSESETRAIHSQSLCFSHLQSAFIRAIIIVILCVSNPSRRGREKSELGDERETVRTPVQIHQFAIWKELACFFDLIGNVSPILLVRLSPWRRLIVSQI